MGDLVAFHGAHKLIVLAHDPARYYELGRVVAGTAGRSLPEVEASYRDGIGAALAVPATPGRHRNVLQHLFGHLKDRPELQTRWQILEAIDAYATGEVPLRVPVDLMRAAAANLGIPYLLAQAYLEPDDGAP